jgi:choline dehydrogenase-like flavoprotein
MLASGIGPKEDLEKVGVDVKHDLPGVGKNLQDHLDGLITIRSRSSMTLGFSAGAAPSILSSPLRYIFGKKGWLTTNYVEAGGFACTRLSPELPDVQFHFVPGYRSHRGRLFEWGHGYAVHTCVLRPKSIGEVKLNAKGQLVIDFNFLSNPEDGRVLVEGLKLARSILADPIFDGIRGKEMLPGDSVQTDEQLWDYIKANAATVFHPVGTCKMGIDEMSVVDPSTLKVRGIEGLRIADASIMPILISGNTNAPCIMIGERAADMILHSDDAPHSARLAVIHSAAFAGAKA